MLDRLLTDINTWLADQTSIVAVLLVGSQARGEARPDSDVDLVLLCQNPALYIHDEAWLHDFGTVESIATEDWGVVKSKRVFYETGLEVEFGIAPPLWAAVDPIDAGTRDVVLGGAKIIYDPQGLLADLLAAL